MFQNRIPILVLVYLYNYSHKVSQLYFRWIKLLIITSRYSLCLLAVTGWSSEQKLISPLVRNSSHLWAETGSWINFWAEPFGRNWMNLTAETHCISVEKLDAPLDRNMMYHRTKTGGTSRQKLYEPLGRNSLNLCSEMHCTSIRSGIHQFLAEVTI